LSDCLFPILSILVLLPSLEFSFLSSFLSPIYDPASEVTFVIMDTLIAFTYLFNFFFAASGRVRMAMLCVLWCRFSDAYLVFLVWACMVVNVTWCEFHLYLFLCCVTELLHKPVVRFQRNTLVLHVSVLNMSVAFRSSCTSLSWL